MIKWASHVIKKQWHFYTVMHPLLRGSVSYAVLWPTGCMLQQTIDGKTFTSYDYLRILRFSLFGSLWVAPTAYVWIRISTILWPQTNLKTSLLKATIEQISYGPFACASFLFGMSILEGQNFHQAADETKQKFWPTYKVGVCIWPILQTINYSMVPDRHRLVYISICSVIWTTFLAFIKHQQ